MPFASSGPVLCPSVLFLVVVPRCHHLGQLLVKTGGIGKHVVDGWWMGGGWVVDGWWMGGNRWFDWLEVKT